MSYLIIAVPFQKRHLTPEIKSRGGKFDPSAKTWSLKDNQDNRQLADLIQLPLTGPTPEERILNVAKTAVELLNSIKFREYRLIESGNRIVIESDPNTQGIK